MEDALFALLASVAGGRRYWGRAPQTLKSKDGPYIVMSRVDGIRDYTLAGPSNYVSSRVQFDVYALTHEGMRNAASDLVTTISGWSEQSTSTTIQGIFIDGQRDLPAADAGEVNHLFRTSIDAIVHHTE